MKEVLLNGRYKDECGNIIVAPEGLVNIKVRFYGENNFVFIYEKAKNIKNLTIDFTLSGGRVFLGDNSISGFIRISENSTVLIGDDVTSTSPIMITCAEGCQVIIGDDCMFATGNQIRSDDAHAIYDVVEEKRYNPSKDIVIGAHVWVAYNAVIFGGASIGHGSIVGYNSFVKKVFHNNSLIIGSPAKTSKESIGWTRDNVLWKKCVPDYKDVVNKIFFDKTRKDSKVYLGDGCSYLLTHINNVETLATETPYFKLDKISLIDGSLSVNGNALLSGVECYNYGEKYKYILLLKGSISDVEIPLGKKSDHEISKNIFDGRHISYRKSKFVMRDNIPFDLSEIEHDEYKLYVKMKVNASEYLFNIADFINEDHLEVDSSQASIFAKDGYLILAV